MKITNITQQVKQTNRYSIFIDGTYAFSLSESGLIEQRLASGQELTPAQLADLKTAAGLDKAFGQALRYVAMRPRSEWELRTYLQRKDVGESDAIAIAERLRANRLLDDAAFARAWVANRQLLKPSSLRKLRLELKQKHVPESVISDVLRTEEPNDRATLQAVIAKKRARYPDNQKLMQYLARQGFGYDDIKTALQDES